MIITKITEQAKNPDRVNIYIDDQFYAGISKLVAIQLGLKAGLPLNPEMANQLEQLESTKNVWDYSLRSLARAPKTERQLRRRLADKFGEEPAQATLQKLKNDGLIDDRKLAESLVGRHLRQEDKSRLEILAELKVKGIPESFIPEALALLDDEYELRTATRLAAIKGRSQKADVNKIGQYLARKGFGYAVIKMAVKELGRDLEEIG